MRTNNITAEDLRGVFSVPSIAWTKDRKFALEQNQLIVNHIMAGGISRLLYGGNAFLHHITLSNFEALLDWLSSQSDQAWCIPSVGPSYGRAMDQAELLKRRDFPTFMALPCRDPRDAEGLEQGLSTISGTAGKPLIIYIKEETDFGADPEAGLAAISRLVDSGVCLSIKYAVIRDHPEQDRYLAELLKRVDRSRVVSGIGERPAVVHTRQWGLAGFTTGSGCIAPRLSQAIFDACVRQDWQTAEKLRAHFLPVEDFRDHHGPARVLHHAVEVAGIARTGQAPPFVSSVDSATATDMAPTIKELFQRNEAQ
jgi:4-hydroxy-tetrahydrodipicolinate synthase